MLIKEGDAFKTTRSGVCVVLGDSCSRQVNVMFPATGYTTSVSAQQLKNGSILDRKLMFQNNKAKREEQKTKPKYELELNDGTKVLGKTYDVLAAKTGIPIDSLKSYACGRASSSVIKTLIRL